jgi:hypothetical protein
VDAGEDGSLSGEARDPVEGGVGEDGVELLVIGEGGGVVLLDVEAVGMGGGEHGGGGVDAGEGGSGGSELLGESAVAAAEVEDVFAGLWGEESDDVSGERGDEAAVGGVGFGVPGLRGLGAGGVWGDGGVHNIIVHLEKQVREEDKNF